MSEEKQLREALILARRHLGAWVGAMHETIDCNDDVDALEKIDAALTASAVGKADADAVDAARHPMMVEAIHLLRGWRRTFEEGRFGNSPINSTRGWLSRLDAAMDTSATSERCGV